MAFCADASSDEAIVTSPVSSTLIFTPVSAMMLRIIFPPQPDDVPNLVLLDLHRENPRSERGQPVRGAVSALSHASQNVQPSGFGLGQRFTHQVGRDSPILMSICKAVTPFFVPVTLKSISPK